MKIYLDIRAVFFLSLTLVPRVSGIQHTNHQIPIHLHLKVVECECAFHAACVRHHYLLPPTTTLLGGRQKDAIADARAVALYDLCGEQLSHNRIDKELNGKCDDHYTHRRGSVFVKGYLLSSTTRAAHSSSFLPVGLCFVLFVYSQPPQVALLCVLPILGGTHNKQMQFYD